MPAAISVYEIWLWVFVYLEPPNAKNRATLPSYQRAPTNIGTVGNGGETYNPAP
jgi:hypothetical protein